MNPAQTIDLLHALSDQYGRQYPPGAYTLVHRGLSWAQKKENIEHMTGQEFAQAVFMASIVLYGPRLAKMVWEQLNLHSSEDLGRVVFQLIEAGFMHKEDEDSPDHFDCVLSIDDFDEVKEVYSFNYEKKRWEVAYEFSEKLQHFRFKVESNEESL